MARSFKKFITPVGVAKFPALTTPDTKFNALGVYKTGLILSVEEAQPLIDSLTEIRDAYIEEQMSEATAQQKPKLRKYKIADIGEPEFDDNGEETGNVIINFKLNAVVQTKTGETFTQAPHLFDTDNKPVSADGLKLWGGSEIAIAGEVIPYGMASSQTFGVSLRLKAIQIVSLKSGGGSSGDSYGFSDGGDGFTAPAFPAQEEATTEGEDDDF